LNVMRLRSPGSGFAGPRTGCEPPERAYAEAGAALLHKPCLQFGERHIGLPRNRLQNEGRMTFHTLRSTVAALLLRRHIPQVRSLHRPADRARSADAEPNSRLAARQPAPDGVDNTPTKINRERLGHACRPPLRQHAA